MKQETQYKTLSESAAKLLQKAEQEGLNPDEVLAAAGINLDGNKLPVNRGEATDNLESFIRARGEAPVPGQSLTNSPDNRYPWEQPPRFANPDEAAESVYQRLLQPEAIKYIVSALSNGASVTDVTSVILYGDFVSGLYNPDVMMLIFEPVMFLVMSIGEKANIDYILDVDLENEERENESKERMNDFLPALQKVKDKALEKTVSSASVPRNLLDKIETETKNIKSLLEER